MLFRSSASTWAKSVLALYKNTGELDSQQIMIRDNSFVYDQNVWRGSIGGEGFLAGLDIASVVDRFLTAIRHGDLQGLLDVLAPDVVVVADGGGVVAASRRPIEGAERVARFIIGAARATGFEVKAVWLNGSPAGRIDIGGEIGRASCRERV